MEDNLVYQIGLTLIPMVGPVLAKNLVAYCGSAEAVYKEKKANLELIPDVGPLAAASIVRHKNLKRAEQELSFIKKNKIQALFYLDDAYPKRLLHCNDAPVMLYYKGKGTLNTSRVLSIVGTRNATDYGRKLTEKIVGGFAGDDVLIVSGLAWGIDVAAHRSAVHNKLLTVGVLAHGIDRMYPLDHQDIAKEMMQHGGLLTEYMSETIPGKENFPTRNRIVAGMADALLIVESNKRGGSMISVEYAISYNRDVFALPGNVGARYSSGCNQLIRANKAGLVESAADIISSMGWDDIKKKEAKKGIQKSLFPDLSPEETEIIQILEAKGKTDIDTLCLLMNRAHGKVSALLLRLEFLGLILSLPGKQYQKM